MATVGESPARFDVRPEPEYADRLPFQYLRGGESERDGAVVVAAGVVIHPKDAGARLSQSDVAQLLDQLGVVG